MNWELTPWISFRSLLMEETYDIQIDQEEAEEIVTVGDAVETLRRATKGKKNGK